MNFFLQLTFAGLNVGVLYMLVALGMVVTYQVSRVESLAQGAFVVYGALLFGTFHDGLGLPLPVAILLPVVISSLMSVLLYWLMLNRFATRGSTGPVVMSLGAALILGELARQFWGLNDRSARPFLPTEPISVFGATVLPHSLLSWIGGGVLLLAGYLVFEKTMLGKALRATADDVVGARLVGIDARRMRFVSFQIAALFGSLAGILLAPLTAFGWTAIFPLAVIGAIGAIGGRWEYLTAAVVSLAIGLFSSYAGGYLSTSWQQIYVYGAFILILLAQRADRRAGGGRARSLVTAFTRRGDRASGASIPSHITARRSTE